VCGVCRVCGGVGGLGGVGCCRVVSLLTFDIPQTALVATLDTYNFMQSGPCESKLAMVIFLFVIVF
jgi:hypothetical protein